MVRLPDGLIERLRDVRSVGAITGAGVSQESGIRTYRGRDGLYDDPEEGDRTVEALSGPTLARDPDRTWRAIGALSRQALNAEPNAGHRALAEIERKVERFALLTQNVDGLHRLAGSRNVIELHGNIFMTHCLSCGKAGELAREILAALNAAPRCDCGGILRPNAVLFGELLPMDEVTRLREQFYREVPDLVIAAGTSALFPYITEPVVFARQRGKLTVEINPEPTLMSGQVDFCLRGNAGEYLPAIQRALPG